MVLRAGYITLHRLNLFQIAERDDNRGQRQLQRRRHPPDLHDADRQRQWLHDSVQVPARPVVDDQEALRRQAESDRPKGPTLHNAPEPLDAHRTVGDRLLQVPGGLQDGLEPARGQGCRAEGGQARRPRSPREHQAGDDLGRKEPARHRSLANREPRQARRR